MMPLSLEGIWRASAGRAKADFMVTPAGRMTHGDLAELVRRFCAAFDAGGLKEGDRLLILSGDEFAACAAFIAALTDGLVPVMLTPDTPADRVGGVVSSVAPSAALLPAARHGEPWLDGVGCVLLLPEAEKRRRFTFRAQNEGRRVADALDLPRDGREPRLSGDPDGLAYLMFTSGTTQNPSGVMITRRNLLSNLATISRILEIDADSRIFNDMVLAHGDGLVQGPMMAFATGSCLVRAGGFAVPRLEEWLNTVKRNRATHFITVPTIWTLIDRYAAHDDYFAETEFRHLGSVAAALDPGLWKRLETRFARPLTNQYGLTETVTSALYAGPHPEAGVFGTVGRPVDCEARIAEQGEEGELELRGTNIFPGYWENPDRSAASFTADGWMRTGDIARRRDDGSFEILGRLKNIIMSAGMLIRPEEIDEVMTANPVVVQSVTVAIPDDTFGEVPMTAVVLDGYADEVALTAHARAGLEALKVPKRIVVMDVIPRGDAGKPKLDAVRAAILRAVTEATAPSETDNVSEAVLQTAADVFRVDLQALSPRSTPDSVPGWDSFTQISLIFALEEKFHLRIPAARAAAIRSLSEAITAVRVAQK